MLVKMWLLAVPLVGLTGFGALVAYDSAMQPVRAERAFVKACTNELFGAGAALSDAQDACDCMAEKAAAAMAEIGPEADPADITEAQTRRFTQECTAAHVKPERVYGASRGASPSAARAPVLSSAPPAASTDTPWRAAADGGLIRAASAHAVASRRTGTLPGVAPLAFAAGGEGGPVGAGRGRVG